MLPGLEAPMRMTATCSRTYDEREQRSDVEILDARDVTAGPLCTIRLPVRVPLGFHATWVPGERLPGGSA